MSIHFFRDEQSGRKRISTGDGSFEFDPKRRQFVPIGHVSGEPKCMIPEDPKEFIEFLNHHLKNQE